MMPDLEVHKISLAEEKDGDQVLEACWIEPIKARIRMAGLSKFGDKLYTQFEPAFSELSPNERVYNMRGHEVLNGVQAATSKRTGCRQENSNPNNYFKIWLQAAIEKTFKFKICPALCALLHRRGTTARRLRPALFRSIFCFKCSLPFL
jgi:hypothetical protein